jgi:hypothetical protein
MTAAKPKEHQLSCRLTTADYRLIRKAALEESRSMADFIRLAALERARARDWRDDTASARPVHPSTKAQEVLVP